MTKIKYIGEMVSKRRSIEMLTEEIQDHLPQKDWMKYEHVVNRVLYEFAKTDGVTPKLYKGNRKQYDYYMCGNCGRTVAINDNYCPNCGHMLNWDSPRCLTGKEKKDGEK